MSLSQLSKYVDRRREELSLSSDQSINTNIPFWLWEDPDHYNNKIAKGSCCFNHMIGAPTKQDDDGRKISMPLLPYQHTLYESLQTYRRLLIMKSRGLGVSEFFLRYIAYCCLTDRFGKDGRVCIATGPRLETATDLMSRLKNMFAIEDDATSRPRPKFERSLSTEIRINGVTITCFPSYNSSSLRGYINVKMIMCDEMSWWPPHQSLEIMSVLIGYVAKVNSNPYIILISTPNTPVDIMQVESQNSKSIFHKHYFDYHYGMEPPWPIYSKKQIMIARQSREFTREFELQPIGESGNIFTPYSIEQCQKTDYNPEEIIPSHVSVGIDPSYGSSNFAITATRLVNGKIQVIISEEYGRDDSDFNVMINRINQIKNTHGITVCYVDSAAPEIWTELKRVVFNEEYRIKWVQEKIKMAEDYGYAGTKYMHCLPVAFSKYGPQMLQHAKSLMDENRIMIDKRYDKLLISLRTAVAEEHKLQKSDMSYDDIFDSFRLALTFYARSK